jgi:all-trans-retinol 13,14-reductase
VLEQAEYDAVKEQWRVRLLTELHRHYPKTEGRVEFCDISTPLSVEHYLPSSSGSAVGLDVTPERFTDPEVRC